MVGLIYGVLFLILALIEIRRNLLNSFVLFTISAIFFKGFMKSKENYYFVGTLIGTIFAVLSLLVFVATTELSFGLFGFLVMPYLFVLKRKLTAN